MITEPIFWFIRIAAALGGAILGFFLSGPVLRLLYRIAFHRPVPGWLLPLGKLAGGALLGALFFFLVSIGGRGLGWGGGSGFGTGAGPGTDKPAGDKVRAGKGAGEKSAREKLVIELLGGSRYLGEGRYYLIKREPPARTLNDVEEFIKDKADKLEVHVLLTDESVAASHPAVGRLRERLEHYQIPTVMSTD